MLLTIIVTVYNLEKYIENCLMSILLQDNDDFEVVVVDNGSDDNSVVICEKIQKLYPQKMTFIKLDKPTFIGRAHIEARKMVTGDYFQFVDGDDKLVNGSINRICDVIREKKPSLIVGKFVTEATIGTTSIKDADIKSENINGRTYEEGIEYLTSLPSFHPVLWRFVVKREYLRYFYMGNFLKINHKYWSSVSDWLAFTNVLLNVNSLWVIEEPFYVYCRREGSTGNALSKKESRDNYYITSILMILLTYNMDFQGYKKKFAISRFELLFSNFLIQADALKEDEVNALVEWTDEYLPAMKSVGGKESKLLQSFLTEIEANGIEKAIQIIIKNYLDSFNVCFKAKNKNKIYVFPMGIKGRGVVALLKDRGENVAGFIDNDEMKNGIIVDGIQCFSRERVRERENDTFENCVFVIATIYRELEEKLKNQLLEMGIDEENIVFV